MMPMSTGGAGGVGGAAAAVPIASAMATRIAIRSPLLILASCRFTERRSGSNTLLAPASRILSRPRENTCLSGGDVLNQEPQQGSHGQAPADEPLDLERQNRVADDLAGGGGRSRDAAADRSEEHT